MIKKALRYGWRAGLGAALLCLALAGERAGAAEEAVTLAPHRAVYDLALSAARGGASGMASVTGRLVYDLTGSPCEGYTQNTRLVTRMTQQNGNTVTSDLRSMTWEDGLGKTFRFESSQYRDLQLAEATTGEAARQPGAGEIKVDLTKPDKRSIFLPAGVYFPVQHTIALIYAARAGKPSFRADLYDGSDRGEKVFDTVAAISDLQAPGANRKLPAVANADKLDAVRSWPMSIAFFEPSKGRADALPSYEIAFWMFENGVSRKLSIDYGEFVLEGDLKSIAFHEPSKCDQK